MFMLQKVLGSYTSGCDEISQLNTCLVAGVPYLHCGYHLLLSLNTSCLYSLILSVIQYHMKTRYFHTLTFEFNPDFLWSDVWKILFPLHHFV